MTLMRDTTSGATARFDCSTSRSTPSIAEAHRQPVLERLDVDVRRVLLDRLGQQRVDQPDDRRLVVAVEQVRRLGQLLGDRREVRVVVEAFHHRHRGAALVRGLEPGVERLRIDLGESDGPAGEPPDLGQDQRRGAASVYRFEHAVLALLEQHAVAFRECERQVARGLDRDGVERRGFLASWVDRH